MSRIPLHIAAVLIVATIAIAGCNEPLGPEPDYTGTLQFSYEGSLAGSFTAEGDATVQATGAPYAAAQLYTDALLITALEPTDAPYGRFLWVVLPPDASGTVHFTPDCVGDECPQGFFAPEYHTTHPDPAADYYYITEGTVAIEERSATHVRGTFQFTTVRHTLAGSETITISNGSFDTPFVPTS